MSAPGLRLVPSAAFALAAALAVGGSAARAYTAEVSFTAGYFEARAGALLTGEVPPQAEVTGSFTISTDAPRDVPDSIGVQGDPGLEVLNTYTAPLAAQLEIAGTAYDAGDLQVHMGFVDGQVSLILVSAVALRPREELPAHIATAGTNDFVLAISFPGPEGETPPLFAYTVEGPGGPVVLPEDSEAGEDPTAPGPSTFFAQGLHVTVSSDAGPPQEFSVEPPVLVEDGETCFAATPSAEAGASLDGTVAPGDLLCEPVRAAGAQSAASAPRLRDARIAVPGGERAALAGLPARVSLTTALGTSALAVGKSDRWLLAAAAGTSASVDAPEADAAGSLRCARVKRAPETPRFERAKGVRLAGRPADAYDVRKPVRVCVGDDPATPDPADTLLCYAVRARGPKPEAADVWVAHEHGVEKLRVSRAKELCLPADEGSEA